MTREEILAMEPGRELDAAVAEKVMGWHKGDGWGGADWQTADKQYAESVFKWNPSESISAAWEVVDRMQDHYIMHFLIQRRYCISEMQYLVGFEVDNVNVAEALTAPEAVCKAALLAVMEGDETT